MPLSQFLGFHVKGKVGDSCQSEPRPSSEPAGKVEDYHG